MNHVDCVIKRDVYPQKMHSCFKNICGISFFGLKISVVYNGCYCRIRTIPPRQLPPRQLPPANSTRDNCPQDNSPPRQLPSGQLPLKGKLPSRQ